MPALLTPRQDGPVVRLPQWVVDNASFLRWVESSDAPEEGKYGFYQGELWVDHTMELLLHNLIKTAIAFEVMTWAKAHQLGQFYSDGMLFSCPDIELSSEPDGIFVLNTSLESKKVWFKHGLHSRVLYGVPDLVIEVISKSSVKKDTVTLRELYHEAGIEEYWLVDSRLDKPSLQILRHAESGYVPVRSHVGWMKSNVLGGRFRLAVNRGGTSVELEGK
jgi:Uma2 family endonuclease